LSLLTYPSLRSLLRERYIVGFLILVAFSSCETVIGFFSSALIIIGSEKPFGFLFLLPAIDYQLEAALYIFIYGCRFDWTPM